MTFLNAVLFIILAWATIGGTIPPYKNRLWKKAMENALKNPTYCFSSYKGLCHNRIMVGCTNTGVCWRQCEYGTREFCNPYVDSEYVSCKSDQDCFDASGK